MKSMIERRRMSLFLYTDFGTKLVTSREYYFTSLAEERQVADEFASSYGYRQGDGHIAITDPCGTTFKKLELSP